jgi:hypothetical protein
MNFRPSANDTRVPESSVTASRVSGVKMPSHLLSVSPESAGVVATSQFFFRSRAIDPVV